MGQDINLVFNLIARTIISSQSLCLAAAQNQILVEVGMAKNIVINNVTLTQIATASASCTSTVEIDVESMQQSIQDTLTEFLDQTNVPRDVDRFTAIEKVSTSFTASNVTSCITNAKNLYRVSIQKVGGTFTWENFSLEQFALAQLQQCSMNFTVGTKTLKTYVQEDLLGLKKLPCEQGESNKHVIIGGVLGGLVLILVIATLAVGLSPTKRKQQ